MRFKSQVVKRMLKRKGEDIKRQLKFQTHTNLTPLFEIAALSRVGTFIGLSGSLVIFSLIFFPENVSIKGTKVKLCKLTHLLYNFKCYIKSIAK